MNDEKGLRRKARAALHAGKLPTRRPDRMWGGPGSGLACALCAELLPQDEVALEFECTGAQPANYQVHVRCFAAWEFERDSASPDSKALPTTEGGVTISGSECQNNYRGGRP